MTVRAALVLGILIALGAAGARADDDPVAVAKTRYLADRDASALKAALVAHSGPHPEAIPPGLWALVQIAAGVPHDEAIGSVGSADRAAAGVVTALHALDVKRARRFSLEIDRAGPSVLANWIGALLRVRVGDDSGAIGRLMAQPAFDWSEHAFGLAVLGATLPATDRLMLETIVERALLRAAARRRVAAVTALAHALAALDPTTCAPSLALGLRALRRLGATDAAAEVLRVAGAAGVAIEQGAIAFERATASYLAGRAAETRRLAARSSHVAGAGSVVDGLLLAQSSPSTVVPAGTIGHAEGDELVIELLARFTTLCGEPTRPDDVRAAARRYDGGVGEDAFVVGFLEERGLAAFRFAGSAVAARATLALDRPVLLWRIVHDRAGFRDRPVIVRGLDAVTGLLVVDEPDLTRQDLVPSDLLSKGRVLCAVPIDRADALGRLASRASGRLGAQLGRVLDLAATGRLDEALEELPPLAESQPVAALYRGFIEHTRALGQTRAEVAIEARSALERSVASAPVLGFERSVLASIAFVDGDREAALAGFEAAIRLEPPNAQGVLARFAVLNAERRDEEALAALDEAVRLDPLDPHVLFLRATVREGRADDALGARADVRRALDRDPTSSPMTVFLADLELDLGRPGEAIRVLEELTRYAPELVTDEQVVSVRRRASTTLMRRATSTSALDPFRRSSDPETRRILALVLAEREDPDGELLLRKLILDEDDAVRAAVARSYRRSWLLRRVETEDVLVRVLIGRLRRDPAPRVRAVLADVLGRSKTPLGKRAVAEALAGPTADADATVRVAAAEGLRQAEVRETRTALVAALADPVLEVRHAAGDSLYRLAGSNHGFDPAGPEAERAAAIEAWEAWLAGR